MASKVLYVVLDGAPDSLSSPRRALEEAVKPNIDSLAERGVCGLMYTVAPGVAPQSDVATLSLLGYNPEEHYPGRGPLEALGAGLALGPGAIALRANFATVDARTWRILDRRVGRSLTSREARVLAEAVDGMGLDGGWGLARFRATIGHRGVLVLSHKRYNLSDAISNTDPAYERRGRISVALEKFEPVIRRSVPLEDSEGAMVAARMVNEFTERAIEVLDRHPVNLERARRGLPKANAILLRDAGKMSEKPPSFEDRFRLKAASIVEMVVERGIARYLGVSDVSININLEEVGVEERLEAEAKAALESLESNSFQLVYVHLKGPDEPGHDGDFEGKVKAIEAIDRHFFNVILNSVGDDVAFIVTSDHATPWDKGAHSSDPVPVLISWEGAPRGPGSFNEVACREGRLGVIDRGYKLLPEAFRILGV